MSDFSHLVVAAGDIIQQQLFDLPDFNPDKYAHADLVEDVLADERIADVALNLHDYIETIGYGAWLALCARHKNPDTSTGDRVSLSVITGGRVGVDVKMSFTGSPQPHLRAVA